MRTKKQLANLNPFKKGAYDERQRKGTETFKKNAKEIKTMREILTNVGSELNSNGITIKEAVAKKLLSLALNGNVKAIEMYIGNIGENPTEKQEITANIGIKKVFITKEDVNKADELIDKELE